MAKVVLTRDAKDDLRDFDRTTQRLVVKGLRKLEDQPEQRGVPLAKELSGYRKLVVGDREVRIIYTVEEDGTVCVVWLIGRRANGEVYELARARLIAVEDAEIHQMLEETLAQVNSLGHD
jgi:mRNA interferase RelE/StbE